MDMSNRILAHDHLELDAALADAFAALEAGDTQRSFHALDIFWARLAVHIRAENILLFPALLRAAQKSGCDSRIPSQDTAKTAIAKLRDDHDFFMKELTALVKHLRELLRDNSRDANPVIEKVRKQLEAVKQRLESHNEVEETKVYEWAGVLLDDPAQKNLSEKIQRNLENLPSRFRKA